jgi:Amt family ammonium transporter
MDVFAEHGVAGIVGLIFNALFAADYVIGLDGVNTGIITGGWVNHNYKQLYIQIAYIVACCAYTFVMSALLAYGIDKIPGLKLRASEEAELLGMDDDQLGEFAYDYVEVRRDYLAWTPAKDEPDKEEVLVNPGDRHGIQEHASMIQGESPNGADSHSTGGHEHTGIQGDRHGIAAENKMKESRLTEGEISEKTS